VAIYTNLIKSSPGIMVVKYHYYSVNVGVMLRVMGIFVVGTDQGIALKRKRKLSDLDGKSLINMIL